MTLDSTDILGAFSVRGHEDVSWPGVLSFDAEPSLRLLILAAELPPQLTLLNKGHQSDILGWSHKHCWTLLQCGLKNAWSRSITGSHEAIEIDLLPLAVWKGPAPFSPDETYHRLCLEFSGIHGIIGTRSLKRKDVTKDDEQSLSFIGKANTIYYVPEFDWHKIGVTDQGIKIAFGSGVSNQTSWTTGDRIQTFDSCDIYAPNGKSAYELTTLASKIEQFLSFVCLNTIRSKRTTLDRDGAKPSSERFERVWYCGAEAGVKAVMFHKALGSFFETPAAMSVALSKWLEPSKEEEVARWLFLDIHDQNVISGARFIAICQAIELLGRQANLDPPFEKGKFRKAANEAAELICNVLELGADESYRNRFRQLIVSNNRWSFRDHVDAVVKAIPSELKRRFLSDEQAFIGRLVKLRNLFVHMDDRNLSFDEAQQQVGEMTYRSLALFAAHQAVAVGLDEQQILRGLINSSIGRAALHYIDRRQQPS